jgi:hypothetical protein
MEREDPLPCPQELDLPVESSPELFILASFYYDPLTYACLPQRFSTD